MSSTERSTGPKALRRRRGSSRVSQANVELCTDDFLRKRKVSELQEMWGFWQNGQRPPTRKAELLDPLVVSLHDEETVRARIEILSDRPREVLKRLVRCDGYRARLADLVDANDKRELESYEVEAAARALSKRGFVQVQRERTASRRGGEVYVMPRDLGDLINGLLREERRGPWQVFSLAGHLDSLAPARRVALLDGLGAEAESGADGVVAALRRKGVFAGVPDPRLQDALTRAAVERGGLILLDELNESIGGGAKIDGNRLRGILEDAGVGTVTTLALGDFGIELGGETVVLFTAVTDVVLDEWRGAGTPEHDRVNAARVDLLTDLQQFLTLVATTPLRVTQGRTIYRAAQHRILDSFIFREDALMDRETIFGVLYTLAFGLELVEVTDESRLKLSDKGRAWDALELTDKIGAIYGKFLEERLPDGRDFHVRRLRRAFAKELLEASNGHFLPLADVPFRVRNDYLANLEEEGVREHYKNRFRYTYTPPRETPLELRKRLVGYLIKRLYPLGVVDIAMRGEEPVGVRLTELGRRLIQGESLLGTAPEELETADEGATALPLVVNPDFEVLLFPEGDVNEVAHTLGRFATRTKSERVAHYRIAREAVERAIVKGLSSDEILAFLEENARLPVPQNVAYSIREWAAHVRFAVQREGVVLTTTDAAAMDDVLAVEDVKRLLIERLAPTAALLRAPVTDWKVQELLRGLGVYFK
jgi:hypothetical protein